MHDDLQDGGHEKRTGGGEMKRRDGRGGVGVLRGSKAVYGCKGQLRT